VTYADVWEFWLRNRDLYAAVDFVTIHILPYWEDFPIGATQAAAHVETIRKQVAAAFPDKEILIGETGWPSAGRMRESALPSLSNEAKVLHEILAVAKRNNYRVNVIEAFDQPWKRQLEGTVGGHWGLFDADKRERKFVWGEAVSDHPHWRIQAMLGIGAAALIFIGAWFAARKESEIARGPWLWVAGMALIGGAFFGWSAEKAWLEGLGLGGNIRSWTMCAMALFAPAVAAAAIVRRLPIPRFVAVLGGTDGALVPLSRAVGLGLVVVCVLALQSAFSLVFDPRYRDFPFAFLTAAALPYLALALQVRSTEIAGAAEKIAASVLALCVLYFVPNESFANWQALWVAAMLLAFVIVLLRPRAARS
jgi:glucan 1,3-beta-glucosidase